MAILMEFLHKMRGLDMALLLLVRGYLIKGTKSLSLPLINEQSRPMKIKREAVKRIVIRGKKALVKGKEAADKGKKGVDDEKRGGDVGKREGDEGNGVSDKGGREMKLNLDDLRSTFERKGLMQPELDVPSFKVSIPDIAVSRSSSGGARTFDVFTISGEILSLTKSVCKDSLALRDGWLMTNLIDLIFLLMDQAPRRSMPIEHALTTDSICIMEYVRDTLINSNHAKIFFKKKLKSLEEARKSIKAVMRRAEKDQDQLENYLKEVHRKVNTLEWDLK
ncbi:hypothetical protein COCNU_02G008480 [Cocos nucifera]|uniref:Uncharacterized protein n=1 Tax=Cocos nucifera TaxID=13894 RepID=A0A8K0HZ80_COCNU|nr:hypothetical protein COCNU_02G008480 [Cocos nucifera]